MKSLIRNLLNIKIAIFFRNFFGIKPKFFLLNFNDKNLSVSDAFFWRTDSNYKTLFKFTNLLNFFYKDKESQIEIIFYDKHNKFIKKITKENVLFSDQLLIDKIFLDGLEDYGVFYIFHKTKKIHNSIIRNSCYLGYSINNNLPSFVHGNVCATTKNFLGTDFKAGIAGRSFFKNQKYVVQNYFDNYDKTELLVHNPCAKKISFSINELNFMLNSGCSVIVDIGTDTKAHIISNCYLLRPIVINHKLGFIDAYHG
tara:strand:- start:1170 stop:1934 length:765 start_codon:yes stop_codon:yes gene_type:complete